MFAPKLRWDEDSYCPRCHTGAGCDCPSYSALNWDDSTQTAAWFRVVFKPVEDVQTELL